MSGYCSGTTRVGKAIFKSKRVKRDYDMRASDVLIEKIKQFEGYRAKAYKCAAGRWTCGYGHTKGVTARTVCDKAKAEEWLRKDLEPIENFLSAVPEVCKTQGRFDACADFCFNLGTDLP